jgi:hypothetical protein
MTTTKFTSDYWKDKLLEKFEDGSFYTINLVHAKHWEEILKYRMLRTIKGYEPITEGLEEMTVKETLAETTLNHQTEREVTTVPFFQFEHNLFCMKSLLCIRNNPHNSYQMMYKVRCLSCDAYQEFKEVVLPQMTIGTRG